MVARHIFNLTQLKLKSNILLKSHLCASLHIYKYLENKTKYFTHHKATPTEGIIRGCNDQRGQICTYRL
jgi:hypothetical protein